jgi:DNA-binding response OmpR family regulator
VPDLTGKLILVVEDDVLIGMALEDSLIAAGAMVIGPCATVAESLSALERYTIDAACLDWSLINETSAPIAMRLLASRIPHVFLTGNSPEDITERFPSATVLTKPAFDLSRIGEKLARLLTPLVVPPHVP